MREPVAAMGTGRRLLPGTGQEGRERGHQSIYQIRGWNLGIDVRKRGWCDMFMCCVLRYDFTLYWAD